jgi:hypothetical protein
MGAGMSDMDSVRNAALEEAAAAVADHHRAGREWVLGSLWDQLQNEAAARIRALKTAPMPSPWISVDERLPERDGWYAVIVGDPNDTGWATDVWWRAHFRNGEWCEANPVDDGQPVKHWMALPDVKADDKEKKMSEERTKAPDEIYLQGYIGSFHNSDVTWNDLPVENDDVRYLRAPAAGTEPVPCPACGSRDVGGASGIVHCYSCKLEVKRETTALATLAWNERAPLIRDTLRLDSGRIMTDERDEFGEEYQCDRRGIDLRAAIDAAMEEAKKDNPSP